MAVSSVVVNCILVGFAAVAVVFARGVNHPLRKCNETGGVRITFPYFLKKLKTILEDSFPNIMVFFYSCAMAHKNFLWTGRLTTLIPRYFLFIALSKDIIWEVDVLKSVAQFSVSLLCVACFICYHKYTKWDLQVEMEPYVNFTITVTFVPSWMVAYTTAKPGYL